MKQALNLAKNALSHEDVPIGAVIVKDNKIISRGENQVQLRKNPTLHAEIIAINKACKKLGTKFLNDCDIYVTLEPCAMCATAISFARIKNVYFAATDLKGGGITANARIYDTDRHLWHPKVHHMQEFSYEAAELLKIFFKNNRSNKNNV